MANDVVRFTTGSEANLSSEPKEKGKVLFAIKDDTQGYIYFDKDNDTRIKMSSDHATTADKLKTARTIDGIKFDGSANIHHFGTCTTAAATAAKVATVDGGTFQLSKGALVFIKFTNENTVANPTLNVNSSGSISIYRYGTTAPSTSAATSWNAGSTVGFIYDGTGWQMIGWLNNNDNTYTSIYCATAAATAAKVGTCTNYNLLNNSYSLITLTTANTSKTALTLNVNNKGAKPIYINGNPSSDSNYTLPAGQYLIYYDGTNYQFRTDGVIPGTTLKAQQDGAGNNISSTYIKQIAQNSSTGIAFSIKSISGAGSTKDTVTIPNASETVAGLVTNADQTFAGNKTFIDNALINKDLTVKQDIISGNGYPYIKKKTYTNILATANNTTNGCFYLADVRPTDFYQAFSFRVLVHAYVPGQSKYNGLYDITVSGQHAESGSTEYISIIYSNFNSMWTSARPIYYSDVRTLNKGGYDAGSSLLWGVDLYASTNPTTSGYARTIDVTLLDTENCSFTFKTAPVKYADVTNTTHYHTYYSMDCCNNGLRETGDDNSIDRTYATNYVRVGSSPIHRYSLIMQEPDGTFSSLVYKTKDSNNNDNAASGHIAATDVHFLVGGQILWNSSGNWYNTKNALTGSIGMYTAIPFDFRYASNCSASLTTGKPVYYIFNKNSDGTLSIDSAIHTQDLPTTADGKVYMFLGIAYSTTSIYLHHVHPLYEYIGGQLRFFLNTIPVEQGGTGKTSWSANRIVYASDASTLAQIGVGTSGQVLKSNGNAAPSWVNQSSLAVGRATGDSAGDNIRSTYIKNITVDGTTLTITKGDNSSSTLGLQDFDVKVNMKARGTTKAYLLGTTTTPTSTDQAVTSVAETGVYFDTTAEKLVATTFKGALEGNATTATTLQTGRTFTVTDNSGTNSGGAVAFNGSQNVTLKMPESAKFKNLTVTNNITLDTGNIDIVNIKETDKFLNFYYDATKTSGASWRIGHLGSGSSDTNYLVIQSGTSTTGTTSWHNVLRLGMNTYDVHFGHNVNPLENNTQSLGTSSLKWKEIYATDLHGNADSATILKSGRNFKVADYYSAYTGSATVFNGSQDVTIKLAKDTKFDNIRVVTTVRPETTNTGTLGTSSYFWRGAYISGRDNGMGIHWNNLYNRNSESNTPILNTEYLSGLPRIFGLGTSLRPSNLFFGIPRSSTVVEYTTNGGSSWTEKDIDVRSLFTGATMTATPGFNAAGTAFDTYDAASTASTAYDSSKAAADQKYPAGYWTNKGIRVTVDMWNEYRYGWVDCLILHFGTANTGGGETITSASNASHYIVERQNHNGTWTTVAQGPVTNWNSNDRTQIIYPQPSFYLSYQNTSTAASYARKIRVTFIVDSWGTAYRYAPRLISFVALGTNGATSGGNAYTGTEFARFMTSYNAPYIIENYNTGALGFDSDLLPRQRVTEGAAVVTNNIHSIGGSSRRWQYIYAQHGNYSGNLTVSGTATISGATTFNSNLSVKGNLDVTGTSTLTGKVTAKGEVEITGPIIIPAADTTKMPEAAGVPWPTYSTTHGLRIYSDGIGIKGLASTSTNDAFWIRHTEATSNSGIDEIAVGDDGNEQIVVRKYNTSNAIAAEIKLFDTSHNQIFRNVYPVATKTYQLGNESNIWNDASIGTLQLNAYSNQGKYGRINFYRPSYVTWINYMATTTNGHAPTGGKPSALGNVTTWAIRSLIEQSGGYGWLWESSTNSLASGTDVAPTPRFAISSNNGRVSFTGELWHVSSSRNAAFITFSPQDVNGTGVNIGSGGLTVIGGGESSQTIGAAPATYVSGTHGGTEQLWLTADAGIRFFVNADTVANNKQAYLDASLQFYPITNGTGSLGINANRWNYIYTNNQVTKRLIIQDSTTANNGFGASNPQITFKNSGGDQNLSLIFTDYDSVTSPSSQSLSPSSLTLIGNQGNEQFVAPRVRVGGYINNSYALSAQTAIINSWIRTVGNAGWYSESYGGGWYMTDTNWIRSYGSKGIYHNTGIMRTDGTFQVGGSGDYINFNSSGFKIGSASERNENLLTINGHIVLEPVYRTTGSYNEGLRINRSKNGYANIILGGVKGSNTGTGKGVWWIGTLATPNNATDTATAAGFYISHNASTGGGLRLQGHYNDTTSQPQGFSIWPRLGINANPNNSYALYINGSAWFNGGLLVESYLQLGTASTSTLPANKGIRILDVRNVNVLPSSIGSYNVNFLFQNTTAKTGRRASQWSSIMQLTGWTSDTYASHQISFNSDNTATTSEAYDGNIYHRSGIGSTWKPWRKLIDSENITQEVQVGGLNLIRNSQYLDDWSGTKNLTERPFTWCYSHSGIIASDSTSSYTDLMSLSAANSFLPDPDTYYTLSFWAKASDSAKIHSYFYSSITASGYNSSGHITSATDGNIVTEIDTAWKQYWVTWKTNSVISNNAAIIIARIFKSESPGITVYIALPKMEKGKVMTGWSRNPADAIHIFGRSIMTGSSAGFAYSGGGSQSDNYSIVLHGNANTGSSGILFTSEKGTTNINSPSDRAFIQYHPYGITTATAEGTGPTLATSGEAGRFVIGVGNDAADQLWLQAPDSLGVKHQIGASSYTIADTNNSAWAAWTAGTTAGPIANFNFAGVNKASAAIPSASASASGIVTTAAQTMAGLKTFQGGITAGTTTANGIGIAQTDGTGLGLSLYGGHKTSMPEYGIAFSKTENHGKFGDVQGDWATYFTMNAANQRGWIWKQYNQTGTSFIAGSLSSRGTATFKALSAEEVYMPYPQGGTYNNAGNPAKGMLIIKLPVLGNNKNTMISFKVRIYTYDNGSNLKSDCIYTIHGYAYGSTGWYANDCYAYSEGYGPADNLTVRFGNNGTVNVVTIGETTTEWRYPKAAVTDIIIGHSNSNQSTWSQGWNVAISETSPLSTTVTTITNPLGNREGRFNNILRLYREGVAASDLPAGIYFQNNDTDKADNYTSAILSYSDHDGSSYGNNMVIYSHSNMIIGSGESPSSIYANVIKNNSSETMWVTSDGVINVEANANTITNRIGFQVTTGGHVIPVKVENANNNAQNLGASGNRWAKLYIGGSDTYGSSTQPIWWDQGVPKATAYSLNATVSSGTTPRLAYYSGTNTLTSTPNITYFANIDATVGTTKGKENGLFIYGATYGNKAENLNSNTIGVFNSPHDPGPKIKFNTSLTGGECGALIFTDHSSGGALDESFHFVCNGSTWTVTSYAFTAKARLTVGQNFVNTSYNFYNNGTAYLNGTTTVNGVLSATTFQGIGSGHPVTFVNNGIVTTNDVKIGTTTKLTTSDTDAEWLKVLLVKLCNTYPSTGGRIFEGIISPNSVGYYKIYIYNTGVKDSSTGLPQYSYGEFRKYTTGHYNFGTSSYSFFCNQIVYNSGSWGITAASVANNLSINGKTYNGSAAVTVGTLGVAYGGTGQSSLTSGSVLVGNGTNAVSLRAVADSTSASAIGTNNYFVTERDVYYGLPSINNSHAYTSSTTIYAPTAGGTANYVLVGNGTAAAPVWRSTFQVRDADSNVSSIQLYVNRSTNSTPSYIWNKGGTYYGAIGYNGTSGETYFGPASVNGNLFSWADVNTESWKFRGLIKSLNNSNTVSIGSQNSSYTHIYNSANIPFIFNNSVLTTSGNLGSTSYPFTDGYFKGSIKTGTRGSGGTGAGEILNGSGGIELYHSSTPYIDFHYGNSTADYTARIIAYDDSIRFVFA